MDPRVKLSMLVKSLVGTDTTKGDVTHFNLAAEVSTQISIIVFLTECILAHCGMARALDSWQGQLKLGQLNVDLIYFTQFFIVKIVYKNSLIYLTRDVFKNYHWNKFC